MKKFLVTILSVLFSFGLLVGCAQEESEPNNASQENASETENQETVQVIITQDKGEEVIAEKEVAIEEGDLLLDVMKENFEIETTEEGFITSIEGVSQDEETGKYWLFDVNGEMAPVGAGELELNPDDKVEFDLSAME